MGTFALVTENFIFPNWPPIYKGFMMNIDRGAFFLPSEARKTNKTQPLILQQVALLPVKSLSGDKHMEPESFCGILRLLTAHPFSSPLQRAQLYVGLTENRDMTKDRWVIC